MRSLWHEIRCGDRVVDTLPSRREAYATIHTLDAIHPDRRYRIRRAKSGLSQFAYDPRLLQGSTQILTASLSAPSPALAIPTAAVEWLSPRDEEQVHEQHQASSTRRKDPRESILLPQGEVRP